MKTKDDKATVHLSMLVIKRLAAKEQKLTKKKESCLLDGMASGDVVVQRTTSLAKDDIVQLVFNSVVAVLQCNDPLCVGLGVTDVKAHGGS